MYDVLCGMYHATKHSTKCLNFKFIWQSPWVLYCLKECSLALFEINDMGESKATCSINMEKINNFALHSWSDIMNNRNTT